MYPAIQIVSRAVRRPPALAVRQPRLHVQAHSSHTLVSVPRPPCFSTASVACACPPTYGMYQLCAKADAWKRTTHSARCSPFRKLGSRSMKSGYRSSCATCNIMSSVIQLVPHLSRCAIDHGQHLPRFQTRRSGAGSSEMALNCSHTSLCGCASPGGTDHLPY